MSMWVHKVPKDVHVGLRPTRKRRCIIWSSSWIQLQQVPPGIAPRFLLGIVA